MARSPSVSVGDESEPVATQAVDNTRLKKGKKISKRFQHNGGIGSDDEQIAPTQPIQDSRENTQEDEGYDSGEEESPSGRKRQRVNEDGDDAIVEPVPRRRVVAPLVRDEQDGYVAGSIVRVKLHNFIIYDDVEFRPGPHLNMIIGANGTGKSSIAAALALGLGFSPTVIKKTLPLVSYVKVGATEGFAEVEVKGDPGQPNMVIRRTIKTNSKKSIYHLNGKPSTQPVITEEVHKRNLNLDNLCCFLPQERVNQFAAMNPQELLRKTQEAAGDPCLTEWHDFLIQVGKDMKELNKTAKLHEGELEQAKTSLEALEADVKALKEKERLQAEVVKADLFYSVAILREVMREYDEKKRAAKEQRIIAKRLNDRGKPMKDFIVQIEEEVKELEDERKHAKDQLRKQGDKMSDISEKCKKAEEEVEKAQSDLKQMINAEKARKDNAHKLRDSITRLEIKVSAELDVEDETAIRDEQDKLQGPLIAARNEMNAAKQRAENLEIQHNSTSARLAESERTLKALKDQTEVRLNYLKNLDFNCFKAVEWLRKNKDRFKMEITEPAIITLSVKDPRHVQVIDNCVSLVQKKTFICHCKEDSDLLNKLINDQKVLGENVRIATWFRPEFQPPAPPLSAQQMRQYGFEAYAIDCVTGPDGLMRYLRQEINMHRTPIGPNLLVPAEQVAAAMVAEGPNTATFASYAGKGILYRVQKSNYGNRLAQTSSLPLRPAKDFNKSQGPVEEVRRVEEQIVQDRLSLDQSNADLNEANEAHQAAGKEHRAKKAESDAVSKRMQVVIAKKKERRTDELKLEADRKKLVDAERPPGPEAERKKRRLKGQIEASIGKRSELAVDAVACAREMNNAMICMSRCDLRLGHKKAASFAVKELMEREMKEYFEAMEKLNNLEKEKKECEVRKTDAKRVAGDKLEASPEHSEAVGKFYASFENPGDDDLPHESNHWQQQKAELQGELDVLHIRDEDAIERHQALQKKHARLASLLTDTNEKRKFKEKEIQEKRNLYVPALENLRDSVTARFSAAFHRIGCNGEINISMDDPDYDKWAIQIQVSFRDNEPLQELSATRQSGGERSLTTMMYLMSLTEVARSPFCLVDEINQGMDQRAEREVHDQLVSVACTKESGQYFLITPKLLPDLKYDERMKILCVNNGEWLNFDDEDGDSELNDGNLRNILGRVMANRRD